MPSLRDVMMEADDAQAARDAAALATSRFAGGRYRAPPEEGVMPTASGIAAAAADPFGLPSYLVGKVSPETRDEWRNLYENNISNQVFGSLVPVPFAGKAFQAAGEGIRTAAKPVVEAIKAAPKTMASVLGIGGGTVAATEAAEGSKDIAARAAEYDPQVAEVQQRIREGEAELKRLGGIKTPEPGKFKSASAQRAAERRAEQAGGRIDTQMKSVQAALDKDRARLAEVQQTQDTINAAAREKALQERPLVERVPAMGSLSGAGGVLAAAAAYNPRLRAVMANRQFAQDLNAMMPEIENAASMTNLTKAGRVPTNPNKGFRPTGQDITAIEQGREMVRRGEGMGAAGEGSFIEGAKAAPMGMAAAAEGSILPYQIDLANQQPGTPAYEAARDRLFTAAGWGKTGVASLVGGTGSMVGAKLPTYRAPAATLESDLARAQGAVNAFDMRKAAAAIPPAAPAVVAPRQAAGAIPTPAGPIPSVPALTKQAAAVQPPAPAVVQSAAPVTAAAVQPPAPAAVQSAAPVTAADLAASQKRMDQARARMDEAFKAAGTAEITPRRAEILAEIQKVGKGAGSAKKLRDLYNQYWTSAP